MCIYTHVHVQDDHLSSQDTFESKKVPLVTVPISRCKLGCPTLSVVMGSVWGHSPAWEPAAWGAPLRRCRHLAWRGAGRPREAHPFHIASWSCLFPPQLVGRSTRETVEEDTHIAVSFPCHNAEVFQIALSTPQIQIKGIKIKSVPRHVFHQLWIL